jgi:hypothetical protein
MKLKRSADPKAVSEQIRSQLNQTHRLTAGAGEATQLINDYVMWANGIQASLLAYYVTPDLSQLFTQRYFHLHNLMHSPGGRRIPEMVAAETEVQVLWLSDEAKALDDRADRFAARGRIFSIAIPDTGMFLHGSKELDRIPWSTYMGGGTNEVRLVVPTKVVEELDDLKDSAPAKTKHRARIALKQLARLLDPPNTPQPLGDGVSIESFVTLDSQRDIPSGDSDILVASDEIETYSQHHVRIITRDLSMSLRAVTAGFEAFYVEPEAIEDGRGPADD